VLNNDNELTVEPGGFVMPICVNANVVSPLAKICRVLSDSITLFIDLVEVSDLLVGAVFDSNTSLESTAVLNTVDLTAYVDVMGPKQVFPTENGVNL
jgi:hypothetical protein